VVGQLAGGVAHEFNNLLAIILGNVDIAEEKLATDELLSKHLACVRKAARRAAELTRQLLAFSRKQVMMGLNARDAMPKGGRLRISTANIPLDKID
jgi:two-component system cell cycle sensor histidine kinase/response regulator CckA